MALQLQEKTQSLVAHKVRWLQRPKPVEPPDTMEHLGTTEHLAPSMRWEPEAKESACIREDMGQSMDGQGVG